MSDEEQIKVEEATERIAKEMLADERYSSYFAPYEESGIPGFLKKFARYKASLEVYGDHTSFRRERLIDQYQDEGWASLENIQLKKLFDLECLWRAEQVTGLSEIEVSKDFEQISEKVLNYPDIPPVTWEEVEQYQTFLHREQYIVDNSGGGYVRYPDYEEVKENYDEVAGTDVEYFDFHNMQTGKQSLLLLPNIRGQKEDMYMQMFFNKKRKENKPQEVPKDEKEPLSSTDEELIKFGAHFGDRKTVNYIKAQYNWMRKIVDPIFFWAYGYLEDLNPEKVPIKAHEDWKEAIYFAAVHHKSKMVAEILPSIFEEYEMKKNLGIPYNYEDKHTNHFSITEWWRECILAGREINGEPKDFNF